MDIFFNIEMKKKNENLIKQLEETVSSYNEIMSYINENCDYNYVTVDLINFYNNLCVECEKQLIILKNTIKINDKKIYEQCDHNFIIDIIDIDPEKEKTICYCTICELTKRE
jgi:uncharacterized protein with von Willebrand factor type A (vWA) domain